MSPKETLEQLNAAVDEAIRKRREWLDAEMVRQSPIKVGDMLYDLESGRPVGRVVELYRYWRDRDNGIHDKNLDWDYGYEHGPRMIDNTSRQVGRRFGTREQAKAAMERRAKAI